MEFTLVRNCWYGPLGLQTDDETRFVAKLDTGAVATTVCIHDVALLRNLNAEILCNYMKYKKTVNMRTASGHTMQTVPCHLRNIRVCDTVLRDFYCLVPMSLDSEKTLIGADLIGSCMVKGVRGGSMLLAGLDASLYKNNFMSVCNKVTPLELYEMSTQELLLLDASQSSEQCLQYKSKFNLTDAEFDKEILRILYKNNVSSIDMLEYIIQHESPIGCDSM